MRNRTTKRLLLSILVVAIVVVLGIVGSQIYSDGVKKKTAQETAPVNSYLEENLISYQGKDYLPRSGVESILFMGVDSDLEAGEAEFINHVQSDFLALLVLDHGEQTYRIIHLNRDTMCDIPVLDLDGNRVGFRTAQLALAHAYGSGGKDSCLNTVKAVSQLLYGADIQYYASMPVQSMAILNDDIGGVEVTIEDDFSGVDPTLVLGQTIRLSGKQAENFVRARGGMEDSSNLRRMERQRQYMNSFLQSLSEHSGEYGDELQMLIDDLSEVLLTNLSVQKIQKIADAMVKYEYVGVEDLPGEAHLGEKFMEFEIDETMVRQLLIELYYRPAGS